MFDSHYSVTECPQDLYSCLCCDCVIY